jgi:aspartyl/asparaginyl-tRNA synthetase
LQAIGKTSELEKYLFLFFYFISFYFWYFCFLKRVGFGDCVEMKGQIVESPNSGQKFEMKISSVNIVGKSDIEV